MDTNMRFETELPRELGASSWARRELQEMQASYETRS